MDHTEFIVLVLQLYDVYREPILGFASQKVLADERIALVSPIIVSTCFSVWPGFAPAGELVAWRVSKGATFVMEQKGPNNGRALRDAACTDAPSGHIQWDERRMESGPTRCAQTRPAK